MLRAKATETESEAGRQIGAAAVAAALGLDQPAAPTAEPSPPPNEPKPQSNIEALVQELAKAVAGREPAERKELIGHARQAFEASRRSALPPPGETAIARDLKAFDEAAAAVIADPPAAALAEAAAPAAAPAVLSGETAAVGPVGPVDPPQAEQAASAVVSTSDKKGSIARHDPPRVSRRAPPASLRVALRVLIAAWLGLGAVLGYAYLHHPTRATSSTVSPPAPAAVPPAPSPNPGKTLPVPNPLVPME